MKLNFVFLRDQHTREADDFISTLDPTKTNKVTFNAYLRDNYGDLDTTQLEKMDKSDLRSRETRRVRNKFNLYFCIYILFFFQTFLADKEKWAHLDTDGDQTLTYEQFRTFLRPEDDGELRRIEINTIITEYDDNKDGKISNDEYLKMTGISILKHQ
jgi:hypothetical protein